jgi:hypothetical protein
MYAANTMVAGSRTERSRLFLLDRWQVACLNYPTEMLTLADIKAPRRDSLLLDCMLGLAASGDCVLRPSKPSVPTRDGRHDEAEIDG